ncbi:MAG: hypothetical protein IPP17_27005 [Bacteroidetes bacterium]|nr:hypothetical protein [Bacteroidota bacterium]
MIIIEQCLHQQPEVACSAVGVALERASEQEEHAHHDQGMGGTMPATAHGNGQPHLLLARKHRSIQ